MQIIIQGELERLTEYLKGNYVLRAQDFQTKLEMSTKLKRKIALTIAFLVMKIRNNNESMRQEILSKNIPIYYCQKKKAKI